MPAYRIQSDIFGLEWKLDRIGYRRHIVSVACENLQHTKSTPWPKDTKEEIRICKSKKNRQHNGQKKKYKRQTTIYT
jgi:hypothetical protein